MVDRDIRLIKVNEENSTCMDQLCEYCKNKTRVNKDSKKEEELLLVSIACDSMIRN